jgi:AcrR family transcriptional regulator
VLRTQAALRSAIVDLVADKGYQAIVVDHIIERAGVTRATFYKHFRDKEHLFASVADDLIDQVVADFGAESMDTPGRRVALLFEHSARHVELTRLILRGEGDGVARRRFHDRITEVAGQMVTEREDTFGVTPVVDRHLLAELFTGQLLAALGWWLEGLEAGREIALQDVVDQTRSTWAFGLLWAIGADDPSVPDAVRTALAGDFPSRDTSNRHLANKENR